MSIKRLFLVAAPVASLLGGCGGSGGSGGPADASATAPGRDASASSPARDAPVSGDAPASDAAPGTAGPTSFTPTPLADLNEPWAMTFLPDGRLLVTEKPGALRLLTLGAAEAQVATITGTPQVAYGGQGGFGDVVLHPRFAENALVYLSWAESGSGGSGAAVGRARLVLEGATGGRLEGLEVIWRQVPKVEGSGHFGHRLAFAPDGHLFVSSGERQKFTPAQDLTSNLGKILRLNDDGSAPADNPFADRPGATEVTKQIWSYGHRNPLGLAFDALGRLWEHEMGPRGGDELNLVERGSNYGYPLVSNGDHYDGSPIPDHDTRPDLNAPEVSWTPVISPAGFVIYTGDDFPAWRGHGFAGGLSARALIRLELDGAQPREAQRFDLGARIREVEQGPDGGLYVLEDEASGSRGRLLKLVPAP